MTMHNFEDLELLTHMLQNISNHRSIGLFTGSACGAIIYTLNLNNICFSRRVCLFFVSLLLGMGCTDSTVYLLNKTLDKFITPVPQLNRTFMAALTAAIAVRLINSLSELLLKNLNNKGR